MSTNENGTGSPIQIKKITLYYAEWCGHCKTFKPEWFKFKAAYDKNKQKIKDKYKIGLVIREYDADVQGEKISEAGVEGFPTIKVDSRNKVVDYAGGRTALDLFKKLITDASEDEILEWLSQIPSGSLPIVEEVSLETAQKGGSEISGINLSQSYKKYIKYKNKCERMNLGKYICE